MRDNWNWEPFIGGPFWETKVEDEYCADLDYQLGHLAEDLADDPRVRAALAEYLVNAMDGSLIEKDMQKMQDLITMKLKTVSGIGTSELLFDKKLIR